MQTWLKTDKEGNVVGKYLLSGSDDATIKIWDIEKTKLLDTLKNNPSQKLHQNGVSCMVVHGNELFSGGQDTNTFFFDLEVIGRRINEFLLMEAEDLRSKKAEAMYNYLDAKLGRRRGKKGKGKGKGKGKKGKK